MYSNQNVPFFFSLLAEQSLQKQDSHVGRFPSCT